MTPLILLCGVVAIVLGLRRSAVWRSRTDDAVDRHPRARQLAALAHTVEPPTPRAAHALARIGARQMAAERARVLPDAAFTEPGLHPAGRRR